MKMIPEACYGAVRATAAHVLMSCMCEVDHHVLSSCRAGSTVLRSHFTRVFFLHGNLPHRPQCRRCPLPTLFSPLHPTAQPRGHSMWRYLLRLRCRLTLIPSTTSCLTSCGVTLVGWAFRMLRW